MTDLLKDALRELAAHLRPFGIRLTIVGGYGLLLRVEAIHSGGLRTLGGGAPVSRSTDDIDWFLGAATITDSTQTRRIRETLTELGYSATAEFLLFQRTVQGAQAPLTIKLDLMAPSIEGDLAGRVKVSGTRIRPNEYPGLHGRLTPEAVFIDGNVMEVDISHDGSGLLVNLPQAFPFLIMKLFALRDGATSKDPLMADRHALDMFSIWSTITETELTASELLSNTHASHPLMPEVREVTSSLFAGRDPKGLQSLRRAARASGVALDAALVQAFTRDLMHLLGDVREPRT